VMTETPSGSSVTGTALS